MLWRREDESGVSGTGVVAEGVQFADGSAALRWKTAYRSTAVYASMDDVQRIHGHGGKTRIVWCDHYENGPMPCTVYGPDSPDGRPGVSLPAQRTIDGWSGESGVIDREGRPIFTGAAARLRGGRGEVSDRGEVIDVYEHGGRLMVGMYGTDCGPAAYPVDEIEVLETREECIARNGGRRPTYGWQPALTIGSTGGEPS